MGPGVVSIATAAAAAELSGAVFVGAAGAWLAAAGGARQTVAVIDTAAARARVLRMPRT